MPREKHLKNCSARKSNSLQQQEMCVDNAGNSATVKVQRNGMFGDSRDVFVNSLPSEYCTCASFLKVRAR